MFSDLVGSTALSARMDAEDVREVNSAYPKYVAETVQRFGGFVAKSGVDNRPFAGLVKGKDVDDLATCFSSSKTSRFSTVLGARQIAARYAPSFYAASRGAHVDNWNLCSRSFSNRMLDICRNHIPSRANAADRRDSTYGFRPE